MYHSLRVLSKKMKTRKANVQLKNHLLFVFLVYLAIITFNPQSSQ